MSVNYLLALGFTIFFFLFEFSFLLDRELSMEIYGALSILCIMFTILLPESIAINIHIPHLPWTWIVFCISMLVSVVNLGFVIFADKLALQKKAYITCLLIIFLSSIGMIISLSVITWG